MSGKGIKRVHSSGYGDHYIHIKIKIPSYVNREQKALIKTYAETDADINGTVDGLTSTTTGMLEKTYLLNLKFYKLNP